MSNDDEEIITSKSSYRASIYPLKYPDIYDYSLKLSQNYWMVTDVKFDQDMVDIKSATEGEKNLISYIFAIFLYADNKVIEYINKCALPIVTLPEWKSFLTQKEANEDIHAQVYSNGAYSLFREKFDELLNKMENDSSIIAKLDWVNSWIDKKDVTYAQISFAFSCFEGISFQGLFCAIYILCQNGKYPGMRLSNEIISRDENLHAEAELYILNNYTKNRISPKEAHKIIKDLVKSEEEFIRNALKFDVIGLSIEKMINYVKYVANNHASRAGYQPVYPDITENPYPVMNKMGVKRRTNFFEDSDANYMKLAEADDGIYDWKKVNKF